MSTGGGEEPVWSSDGERLFFRTGLRVYAVDVSTSPSLTVGRAEVVLDGHHGARGTSGLPDFDVDASGERFVMIRQPSAEGAKVHVVLDFFQEIEAAARR